METIEGYKKTISRLQKQKNNYRAKLKELDALLEVRKTQARRDANFKMVLKATYPEQYYNLVSWFEFVGVNDKTLKEIKKELKE